MSDEIEWTDDDEAAANRAMAKLLQREAQSRFIWKPGDLTFITPAAPPTPAPAPTQVERARALQKKRALRKARR
jgi:hypothetical protein